MKMVKALRGCNGFLFNCSTMTVGGPDDSIEKGDTVILSLDFPSVLRSGGWQLRKLFCRKQNAKQSSRIEPGTATTMIAAFSMVSNK